MVIEGEVFAVCHIHLTKKQKIAVVYIFFVKNPTSTNFLSFCCGNTCHRPAEPFRYANVRTN